MIETLKRYSLIFLGLMFLTQPLILIQAPIGSPLYIAIATILLGLLFSVAFYAVASFRGIVKNLDGNTKEITKRLFMSSVIVIAYLFLSAVNSINASGAIKIDPLIVQVIGITNFCLMGTYFYTIFDTVRHMRKQPKMFDSQRRRVVFEGE